MTDIGRMVASIARSEVGVLIVGETGTGKSWLASLLHRLSLRRSKRLVVVDPTDLAAAEEELFGCESYSSAGIDIARGVFEDANGGTIFFRQVSDLPALLQRRVTKAIEQQRVRRTGGKSDVPLNIRFVASVRRVTEAANRDLAAIREVYARVSPIIINLPPLRERREDIGVLAEHYLRHHAAAAPPGDPAAVEIGAEAMDILLGYDWPGNITQLHHALDYALTMCRGRSIQTEHLPLYVYGRQTAAMLGDGLKLLYRKLKPGGGGSCSPSAAVVHHDDTPGSER